MALDLKTLDCINSVSRINVSTFCTDLNLILDENLVLKKEVERLQEIEKKYIKLLDESVSVSQKMVAKTINTLLGENFK